MDFHNTLSRSYISFCQKVAMTTKSSEILRDLSNHFDWSVRYYVAKNPNTKQITLKNLANDMDDWVKSKAQTNIIKRCFSCI